MDCRAFELSLAGYGDDGLTAEVRADFELHAATCADCGPTFGRYVRSTCAWIADFCADYFDGALSRDEVRVFEWHLAVCAECRCYLRQYQATVRMTRTTRDVELPIPQRLIAVILAARGR